MEFKDVKVCEYATIRAKERKYKWWNNSDELVSKKIIRNFNLGTTVKDGFKFEVKRYKDMEMYFDKTTNCIVTIHIKEEIEEMEINYDLKRQLNEYLGITDMLFDEGLKGDTYKHLPKITRKVYNSYTKTYNDYISVLELRKRLYDEMNTCDNIEEVAEYKYYHLDRYDIRYNTEYGCVVWVYHKENKMEGVA